MPHTLKLDARLLAAMDDLSLLAQTIVEGFLEGLHRSPFLGYSTEFSAYRAYTPGDNLRFIDWKLWGRTDEFYVKQFEDDTNLRGYVFLDNSASMDFGEGDHNKFDYARILAAVLAHLMTRQHDAPGLALFNDRVNVSLPTRATRDHADEIFRLLTGARASGQTAIDDSLLALVQRFSRRGLAVVISDFFAPEDSALELLRQLHAARQEIIVFHVLAPEELDLPYEGEFMMRDSETGGEVPLHTDVFRKEYQKRVGDFCERIRQECIRLETDYVRLRTDEPLDVAMIAYLERRAAI
ncbi:MAG: DUF58 domain-containing protein [Verrucomicrobia bacterium]|nr:DUF58 domain-containing protein [Verrucomicrobiota bacterium]